MGFGAALSSGFRKIVTFSGRASRSEYWWFALFPLLLVLTAVVLVGVAFFWNYEALYEATVYGGIALLAAFYVSSISLGVRRLHDTGRSGWWLLPSVPLLAALLWLEGGGAGSGALDAVLHVAGPAYAAGLVFLFLLRGAKGENRYGPDPLAGGPS